MKFNIFIIGLTLFLSSCSRHNQSKLENYVVEANIQKVAKENNLFAFDLYHQLSNSQNLFFSPLSISEAFAMVYVGADKETKLQIAKTLHFASGDIVKEGFKKLSGSFKNKDYEFTTANALWVEKTFGIKKPFIADLKYYFDAKSETMDFINYADSAKDTINQWISKQTNNRINNMIEKIEPPTKLILSNAVYFKAKWLNEFDKDATRKEPFFSLDKKETKVEMMHQVDNFDYVEKADFQAIVFPYKVWENGNIKTSMTVILPKKGEYKNVMHLINSQFLDEIKKDKKDEEVILSFPKFKFTTKTMKFQKVFQKMGMEKPFTPSADFLPLSDKKGLHITKVLHKAFIEVSEKETEAAVATVVEMGLLTSPPPQAPREKKVMNVNRPFIMIIQDTPTGQILFLGNIIELF
jgi:serpin B